MKVWRFDKKDAQFHPDMYGIADPIDAASARYRRGTFVYCMFAPGIFQGCDIVQGCEMLWAADAAETLRKFACECALEVAKFWDPPDVVLEYLRTQDPSLCKSVHEIVDKVCEEPGAAGVWTTESGAASVAKQATNEDPCYAAGESSRLAAMTASSALPRMYNVEGLWTGTMAADATAAGDFVSQERTTAHRKRLRKMLLELQPETT